MQVGTLHENLACGRRIAINMNDELSETTTCDICGTPTNGKQEVCEDCIYWSCDLIDENEDKVSERDGIPTEAMYDREVAKAKL